MGKYVQYQGPILEQPIKFLGASVINFNANLGIGSNSESSLTVDLVEDCEATPSDEFTPVDGSVIVGDPVYFSGGGFTFGGVLTSWTQSQSSSGKTYNVTVTDPRQLLQNVSVVVDSYLGPPESLNNYINAYSHFESEVADGNCAVFGSSSSTERGMPYTKVIEACANIDPTIYSPTGAPYQVQWSDFPSPLPEYYRVTGPQTVLQLLTDVCDVLGFNFYVYLEFIGGIPFIRVGTIDLKNAPTSFNYIYDAFNGSGTEISYGQELRNEVTKAMVIGEQVHYLSYVTDFEFYFGEDTDGENLIPITPTVIDNANNTFWFAKRVDALNATLTNPLGNGPYYISEQDIRAAMNSYESWQMLVMTAIWDSPGAAESQLNDFTKTWPKEGTLNRAIQTVYPTIAAALTERLDNQNNAAGENKGAEWVVLDPNAALMAAREEKVSEDLAKIHAFVQDLGNTYYGKQWLVKLNEKICYYPGEDYQEKVFSSVPTNNGGWVDGGSTVLNLGEPELDTFRTDDGRITAFAGFATDGVPPDAGDGSDDTNTSEDPGETPLPTP